MAFSVTDITCLLGGRKVLDKASFRVGDGEKVVLVGENGSGKSTLLKIVAGLLTPDSGDVSYPKGTTIGYLPQEAIIETDRTLLEDLLFVFKDLVAAQKEMEELEHLMAETDPDSREFEKISHRYDHLQHEMIRRGGYSLESEIGKVTAGLGFTATDLDRPCRLFSGGWQMRILLARLLLQKPDIMLLDEPTNHLDLESILWLEDWIRSSPCDLMMVSHERAFMDNLATRTFELHLGTVSFYKGNYSAYLSQREERYEQMRRARENQQQQINQIQRFIDKNRADNSRAAQVQSRIRILEAMEILPLPPRYKSIHFAFPQPDRGNKDVITLVNCDKAYGDKPVLAPFDLTVYRGERVALVGLNGAGKSTLMRILAGTEKPSHGKRIVGPQTVIESFSQYQHDELNPSKTVLDSLYEKMPLDQSANARNILGAFLFSGDDVFKPVSVLSGGEKTRLRLARMLFSRANCLLMDEPTNHLDVASRGTLEQALTRYEGTLVFVSHDRVFMDRLAQKVIEIHEGSLRHYPGNFTDYLHAKQREVADGIIEYAPFLIVDGKIHFSGSMSGPQKYQEKAAQIVDEPLQRKSKEDKRQEAARRNELSRKKRPIEKEIRKQEEMIQASEHRLEEINELLQKPEIYQDSGKCAELVAEQRRLQTCLGKAMTDWEKHNSQLETLQAEYADLT